MYDEAPATTEGNMHCIWLEISQQVFNSEANHYERGNTIEIFFQLRMRYRLSYINSFVTKRYDFWSLKQLQKKMLSNTMWFIHIVLGYFLHVTKYTLMSNTLSPEFKSRRVQTSSFGKTTNNVNLRDLGSTQSATGVSAGLSRSSSASSEDILQFHVCVATKTRIRNRFFLNTINVCVLTYILISSNSIYF